MKTVFMNGSFITQFPEAWWKLIKNPSSVFSAGSHSCRLTHIWNVLYCLCFPLSAYLLYWYHVFEAFANHVPAFYQNEINKLFGYVLGGYHRSLKCPFCSHTHHLLLIRRFSGSHVREELAVNWNSTRWKDSVPTKVFPECLHGEFPDSFWNV